MFSDKFYKSAFYKIFLSYFISTLLFILLSTYLYIKKQKLAIFQETSMNMYIYYLKLKESSFKYEKEGYSYKITLCATVTNKLPILDLSGEYYTKVFSSFYQINIEKQIINVYIDNLYKKTLTVSILLIILFFILSWFLTVISLKPMKNTISHLDRFLKDLIHDLNTPIASLKINLKIMQKKDTKNILKNEHERIQKSINYISSLYQNLSTTLEKDLPKERVNLNYLIKEIIPSYEKLYPKIIFHIKVDEIFVMTNKNAILRIIDNIISNSCKYSKEENALIKIYFKKNILIIEDNGKGMKYPQRIFERNYQENTSSGYGIGAHIIYRLCNTLKHDIKIESKINIGTKIFIYF